MPRSCAWRPRKDGDEGDRRTGIAGGAAFAAAGAERFRREAAIADGVVVRLNTGSHPRMRFVSSTVERIAYAQGGPIFGYRPGDRVTG
jgi:ferric-dicitrate binding protein FerR (iron transport regulator)